MHPLYSDPELVARVTREHLDAGRSVFQIFQLGADEHAHSLRVLELLKLPDRARVLSLGCGVGGMERYWHETRPDLEFELVNNSQVQLDLCVCPGRRVLGDANTYTAAQPADCVVLAYVLGHCDVPLALAAAAANARKGGVVAVLDVFNGSASFDSNFCYGSPTGFQMRDAGFERLVLEGEWHLAPVLEQFSPWIQANADPGFWVRHV